MNARLTVNRYGAVCLNSSDVWFGDTDLSADPRHPDKPVLAQDDADRFIARAVAEWGVCFRVYRTAAGLRLIEVSRLWNPRSEDTRDLMRDLRCDTAYIAMTARQNCFRARLTPKPWRAAVPELDSMETVEAYAASQSYRVAEWLGHAGIPPATVEPAVAETIELHDRLCGVHLSLPLT